MDVDVPCVPAVPPPPATATAAPPASSPPPSAALCRPPHPPPPAPAASAPPRSRPPSSTLPRIDLVRRKRRLDEALGDAASEYWVAVERYLCARISRNELDVVVHAKLPRHQLHLHNDFFLAVLYNAQSGEMPPSKRVKVPGQAAAPAGAAAQERSGGAAAEKKAARPKKKAPPPVVGTHAKAVKVEGKLSATPGAVPMTKALAPEPIYSPFMPRIAVPPHVAMASEALRSVPHRPMRHIGRPGADLEMLRPEIERATTAYPWSSRLPSVDQIRRTLQHRAREHGLRNVSESATVLMTLSLQSHLQAIVTRVLEHARPYRHEREAHGSGPGRPGVGLEHLLGAVTRHPHLVGDELPLICERINLLLC